MKSAKGQNSNVRKWSMRRCVLRSASHKVSQKCRRQLRISAEGKQSREEGLTAVQAGAGGVLIHDLLLTTHGQQNRVPVRAALVFRRQRVAPRVGRVRSLDVEARLVTVLARVLRIKMPENKSQKVVSFCGQNANFALLDRFAYLGQLLGLVPAHDHAALELHAAPFPRDASWPGVGAHHHPDDCVVAAGCVHLG